MKLGVIISLYAEYDNTLKNIHFLKKQSIPIIVVQSEPPDPNKIIDSKLVDHYKIFHDLAGTVNIFTKDPEKTINHPLGRNLSYAFRNTGSFNVDWWVVILGDVELSDLKGIKKIIEKMILQNKTLGITREIGLVFDDKFGNPGKIEKSDSHNFVPTFFILNTELIKKGIFQDIKIVNPFTMEECMGVAASKFFEENNYDFFDQCYIISDYAYPKFIEGLKYNSDRTILPRYVDGAVNAFRRFKTKFS
jgi:hypothetical protein